MRQLHRCLFSAALPGRRRAIKTFPQCEIGHILRRRRFLYSGGHARPSGGYGNHEDHAGSFCGSWPFGARDKWRERIPIEGKRLSIISKLRPARVCESVVLLVENQPQGEGQADQTLRSRRVRASSRQEGRGGAPFRLSRWASRGESCATTFIKSTSAIVLKAMGTRLRLGGQQRNRCCAASMLENL